MPKTTKIELLHMSSQSCAFLRGSLGLGLVFFFAFLIDGLMERVFFLLIYIWKKKNNNELSLFYFINNSFFVYRGQTKY